MSSVITVKDMCLWYGQVQALKNINEKYGVKVTSDNKETADKS